MQESSQIKQYYRQCLPHIQHLGHAFFVTFRLSGSIPRIKIKECKLNYHEELESLNTSYSGEILNYAKFDLHRKYIKGIDKLLHSVQTGPTYLSNRSCADICKEQLHRLDNKLYKLLAYSIMNNHIHILIDTSVQLDMLQYDPVKIEHEFQTLDKILKRIKGASAYYCNKVLERSGQFWERESYDTYIRHEKMLKNVISYILDNPVKAGLVKNWDEYEWNYLARIDEENI